MQQGLGGHTVSYLSGWMRNVVQTHRLVQKFRFAIKRANRGKLEKTVDPQNIVKQTR